VGGPAHVRSYATVKAIKKIPLIKVEIILFLLTYMFNRIQARSPATMVAKTASIVVGGGQ